MCFHYFFATLKDYQKQLVTFQEKKENLQNDKQKLPEIPKASESMFEIQKLIVRQTGDKSKLEVQVDELNKGIKDREDWIKGKERDIAECQKQIDEFKSKHPYFDKEISDLEGKIQNLTLERNKIRSEISDITFKLESNRKAQVGGLKSNIETCPVCDRPLTIAEL